MCVVTALFLFSYKKKKMIVVFRCNEDVMTRTCMYVICMYEHE